MDPKLDDAFVKAIRSYFEGKEEEESNKASPNRKYSKKVFDTIESDRWGEPEPKTEMEKFKKREKDRSKKKKKD